MRVEQSAPLRIAFLHPELGLGGAERWVLDAALALQRAGHRVTVFTAGLDAERSFADARSGALDVRVAGDFLPRHVLQHARVPCALSRMAYLSAAAARERGFDLVFCDLLAHVVPLVRAWCAARVVFFGHYPDSLLVAKRTGLYRLYRAPLDWLEGVGLGRAHRLLVNSRFTAQAFRRAFPTRGLQPAVVYPGVPLLPAAADASPRRTVTCIARFAPDKNLPLFLETIAALRARIPAERFAALRWVVAGGYDHGLQECRSTLRDLERRAAELQLGGQIEFVRSPSDREKAALLSSSLAVVHTSLAEHLGLVPLEAMAAGAPVIAVDAGGPRETIEHGRTGFLCPPRADAFADALASLVRDPERARSMGCAGRAHIAKHFSTDTLARRLLDATLR